MLTGGGTGGHITPILAVAHELKRLRPDLRLVYIGERRGKFADVVRDNADIDEIHSIFAGKFRRYHGESFLKRLFAIRDHLLNFRDAFYVLIGILQSLRLLGKLQPAAVFQKGGFVGMPVGLAAAMRKIPFATHDSDILPGLANRVVSRWARFNATGMPAKYYPYPEAKVRYIGVLLADEYQPVSDEKQRQFKGQLEIPGDAKLVFVTGGSLGSRVINLAMVKLVPDLLARHNDLHIIHQVGKGNASAYGEFSSPRLRVTEFVNGLHRYYGAADVVVTRAGATNLAECGMQGKATVVVANPLLTGGHQLKNVEYLLQHDAVVSVNEKTLSDAKSGLAVAVSELLSDSKRRQALGAKLHEITPADATPQMAKLLLELVDQ